MENWSKKIDFEYFSQQFGSPLYIFNPQQLEKTVAEFSQLVNGAENIYYPVKANSSYALLAELQKLGCSVDCASNQEIDTVINAGFCYDQIIYNSPAPDYELIQRLLSKGSKVVIDSVEILTALEQRIVIDEVIGELFVRVNPETSMEYLENKPWIEMTQHASDSSKFGIPSENIVATLAQCSIPVSGLHVHVGTQMDNLDVFSSALDMLHRLREEIQNETKHEIKTIDLGGGLGINFVDNDQYPDVDTYRNSLIEKLGSEVTYIIEPGQALVGDAFGLLTRVKETKTIRDKKWAIVDVGSNELMKVSLLKWFHRILDKNHNPLPFQGNDSIGGPLCFAGDVILENTDLSLVNKGDVLFIQHVGAYCSAASNNFNGFLKPAMVIVDNEGNGCLIEKGEDYFASPSIIGYEPIPHHHNPESGQDIELEQIHKLSSTYLSEGANDDRFKIVKTKREGDNALSFTINVESSLGVLSMPLATRLMSEVGIISALYFLKKEVKDVSVWGTRLFLTSDQIIRVNKTITCQVYISPTISDGKSNSQKHLAYMNIENGRFTSVFKFSV